MALRFYPSHNLVAILECTHNSALSYQEGMGFFKNSLLRHALTASPVLYVYQLQQFWQNASVNVTEDGVEIINSVINGEELIISEALIRNVLRLHDEQGVVFRERDFVENTFRQMGYEDNFPRAAFKKGHLGSNWKFIMHIFIHSLSSRRGGFDEVDERIATAMALTCTGQIFNFSYHIFDCLKRNVLDSNKFMMYPRFLQLLINSCLPHLQPEGPTFEQNVLTHILFSSLSKMYSTSKHSGVFTQYFDYMREIAALHQPLPYPNEEVNDEANLGFDGGDDFVDDVNVDENIIQESVPRSYRFVYSRRRKVKTLAIMKCEQQAIEINALKSKQEEEFSAWKSKEEEFQLQLNKQIKLVKRQKKLMMQQQDLILFWKHRAKSFKKKYLHLKNSSTESAVEEVHHQLGVGGDIPADEETELVFRKKVDLESSSRKRKQLIVEDDDEEDDVVDKGKDIVDLSDSSSDDDDMDQFRIFQRQGYESANKGGIGFEQDDDDDDVLSILKLDQNKTFEQIQQEDQDLIYKKGMLAFLKSHNIKAKGMNLMGIDRLEGLVHETVLKLSKEEDVKKVDDMNISWTSSDDENVDLENVENVESEVEKIEAVPVDVKGKNVVAESSISSSKQAVRTTTIVDAFDDDDFAMLDRRALRMSKGNYSRFIQNQYDIKSWGYDQDTQSIAVRRMKGKVQYFYSYIEILNFSKSDLITLTQLELKNADLDKNAQEFVAYLHSFVGSNFKDIRKKYKGARSTVLLDTVLTKPKKKNVIKSEIKRWYCEQDSGDVIVERVDGQKERLYESSTLKRFAKSDILKLKELPLIGRGLISDADDYTSLVNSLFHLIKKTPLHPEDVIFNPY